MQVIPVIDILAGQVVRGVAGQRDDYRPIESCLTKSTRVQDVANAFRRELSLRQLYVADLDAILQDRPHDEIYRALAEDGFDVMVDAGVNNVQRAMQALETGVAAVVAGLESLPEPAVLSELIAEFGGGRIVFSLDLKHGRPLGNVEGWGTNAEQIASNAIDVGVRRMTVLDLANVGVGQGLSTIDLCRRINHLHPEVQLIAGGGIREIDDLIALSDFNLDGILVASAFHNGRIGWRELASWREQTAG